MRNILIVDDEKINRDILTKILSNDYQTIKAANGKVAIDILIKNKIKISAVLLDLNMPIMDGKTFLKQYTNNISIKRIPIIVLTTAEGDNSEIEALEQGATDFLVKPFNPNLIIHRLKNLIDLQEASEKVTELEKDSLTGLYTKNVFIENSEKLLKSNTDRDFKLFIFDFDNFRIINDLFGISNGDKILQTFAKALSNVNYSGLHIIGRISGNQFVVILEKDDYALKDEKWLNDYLKLYSDKIKIHIRIGCYNIDNINILIELMCLYAQHAADMDKGKFDGKICYYDSSIRDKMIEEQEFINEMDNAIKTNQFVVYYQPKYNLFDGTLYGAEALVRWNHPVKGFLQPGKFIQIFEKNGFITDLDFFVWETTCQLIQRIEPILPPNFSFSVNVSRVDVYNPKLVDILQNLIIKYKINIKRIHLEITESAYMDNSNQLINVVNNLRAKGFIIEMDDFGTGYSSLNMLINVPVDIIKLDLFFLKNNSDSNKKKLMLSTVIDLAHQLNLTVISEGIDNEIDKKMLKNLGCRLGQGYLMDKPMEEQKLLLRLEENEKLIKFNKENNSISNNISMPSEKINYENLPIGVIILKAEDNQLIFSNKAVINMLGYTKEEPFKNIQEITDNLSYNNLNNKLKLYFEDQNYYGFSNYLKLKNGKRKLFFIYCTRFHYNKILFFRIFILNYEGIFSQEEIINELPGAIIKVNLNDFKRIDIASDNFYKAIGYSREEFFTNFDNNIESFIYFDDRKEVFDKLKNDTEIGFYQCEYRLINKNKTIHKIKELRNITKDITGKKVMVSFCVEINGLKINKVQDKISEQDYDMIIPFLKNYIFEWDKAKDKIIFSELLSNEFGINNIIFNFRKKLENSDKILIETQKVFNNAFDLIFQGIDYQEFEVQIKTVKGKLNWYKCTLNCLKDSEGITLKIIGYMNDITKQKEAFYNIQKLANKDSLTSLLNHRAFYQIVAETLEKKNKNFSYTMIDVDDFKKINDYYGHYCGDIVLKEISKRIEKIINKNVYISRIGGDEFSVFFYDLKDKEELKENLKSLKNTISTTMQLVNKDSYTPKISVGAIYFTEKNNLDFDECYKQADKIMYQVKGSGKDNWKIKDLTK